jgi:hypothetical protein
MKHLKYFEQASAYEAYKNGSDYVLPNVSYVEENKVVFYMPKSEEPAVAPVGASIYGLDGKFYSVDEWTASGKSNSDAVGVAVSDGEHSFVIHPTADPGVTKWSSSQVVTIDGVVNVNYTDAKSDFAGEANTAAILAAVQAGTIEDAPAAQYCAGITFANGKKGYLPSAGELLMVYSVLKDINSCMTTLGGIEIDMRSKRYWSSTQNWAINAIYWDWYKLNFDAIGKKNTYHVRAVAAL